MPIELDLADPDDDEMSVEDEEHVIERALHKAPEKDLVDLAGILGMVHVHYDHDADVDCGFSFTRDEG